MCVYFLSDNVMTGVGYPLYSIGHLDMFMGMSGFFKTSHSRIILVKDFKFAFLHSIYIACCNYGQSGQEFIK